MVRRLQRVHPKEVLPPAVVLRRTASFAADPQSARHARRLLRAALSDAERLQWHEAAALALSELVTNVVLHAHTPFVVVIEIEPDRLRVEVRDSSPVLPVPASHDPDSTTGRGLALVSAMTDACGAHSLQGSGKVVWFTLSDAARDADPEALLAAWDVDDIDDMNPRDVVVGRPATDICLLDLPATLWLTAREHHEALLRELVLYLAEHDDVTADLSLAQDARGHVMPALQQAVAADPAATPAALTLPLRLPDDLRAAFVELRQVLRVGEHLAAAGRLLVEPGRRDVVAVREWLLGEVIDQLAGAAPTPWRSTPAGRPTPPASWEPAPSWEPARSSEPALASELPD